MYGRAGCWAAHGGHPRAPRLTRASDLTSPLLAEPLSGPCPSPGRAGTTRRGCSGRANLEPLGVSPSCRAPPWWHRAEAAVRSRWRLPRSRSGNPAVFSATSSPPGLRLLCSPGSGSSFLRVLGLAKEHPTPARAAARLRVLPAASPLREPPPARFWVLSSSSPASQRHCSTSASGLPWNPQAPP